MNSNDSLPTNERPRERAERTSPITLVDCGCKAVVYTDGSGIEIEYCPMHQAAPEMLSALKTIVAKCEDDSAPFQALLTIVGTACIAIDKAGGAL